MRATARARRACAIMWSADPGATRARGGGDASAADASPHGALVRGVLTEDQPEDRIHPSRVASPLTHHW
jgi:hypothetical protein